MKKSISRTIVTTEVKIAKLEEVDGALSIVESEETLLGGLSKEEVEKALVKKHGAGVTVKAIETKSDLYEMPLEEFIAKAAVKALEEDAE
jgi:hypothetical protein